MNATSIRKALGMMNAHDVFKAAWLDHGFKTVEEEGVRGAVTVPVRYSDDLVPGVLFLPRHFADAPASELMIPGTDGEPRTTLINVRVERA